jgi:hypothetical protein
MICSVKRLSLKITDKRLSCYDCQAGVSASRWLLQDSVLSVLTIKCWHMTVTPFEARHASSNHYWTQCACSSGYCWRSVYFTVTATQYAICMFCPALDWLQYLTKKAHIRLACSRKLYSSSLADAITHHVNSITLPRALSFLLLSLCDSHSCVSTARKCSVIYNACLWR